MGLISTLFDYGNQAYEGLKPKQEQAVNRQNPATEEVNYPQIRLSGQQPPASKPSVQLRDFQLQLGQDTAYVKTTLRQKLAEYGLPSQTTIRVVRNETGQFEVEGKVPEDIATKIEFDLNQNPDFKMRFLRLSQHAPTLDYLQNVMRLSSLYGGENQVFNSILSENPQNNSLQDISQRFSQMNKVSNPAGDSFTETVPGFSVAV